MFYAILLLSVFQKMSFLSRLMGSVAISSHLRSETLLPLTFGADNMQVVLAPALTWQVFCIMLVSGNKLGDPGMWKYTPHCYTVVNAHNHLFPHLFLLQDLEGLKDCLPLTFCFRCHVSQLIALCDESGYTTGQIFYPTPDVSQPGRQEEEAAMDNFITGASIWWRTSSVCASRGPALNSHIALFPCSFWLPGVVHNLCTTSGGQAVSLHQ